MTARRSVDSGRCASSSLGRSLVLADGSSTEARTIDPREYRRHPPHTILLDENSTGRLTLFLVCSPSISARQTPDQGLPFSEERKRRDLSPSESENRESETGREREDDQASHDRVSKGYAARMYMDTIARERIIVIRGRCSEPRERVESLVFSMLISIPY